MAESTPLQIVQDWFDAFNRGEGERHVLENVHPESVVDEGTGGTFLPDAEVLYGPEGFWRSVRKGTDLFDDVKIEVTDHAEGRDAIVVGMHVTGVGKGSGAPLDFVRWDVYRFRDGRIHSVHLFAERADAERDAGVN